MNPKDAAASANHVSVTINGRQYRMACEPGQEPQLLGLADNLESRIQSLRGRFGEIGDARLTVMAALMMADELLDVHGRLATLQQEVEVLREDRTQALDRTVTTNRAVAAALNSAAERIERTTQVLNRTIGGGIAIG
ncbi:cell division protein ZapA [Rhodopseudomonas palustris HaA2]|uniref:Cell division protein ZapA n=1 Tax=Rhodopseudomonas palustris (strain HaA2) TaxID=316058 RepID=Q2IRL3_RHOP2|nr:cell division protein ZapA [Rhodopseudomonas palustris]ABD09147.1 cell division protein ZapA [Rhodopseudomonas palustris HaA2]